MSFFFPLIVLTITFFANVKIEMGQANEKIARVQDAYVASASESWLESIERSLAQMKEYQVARPSQNIL